MGLPASTPHDLGPLGKRGLETWEQASSLSSPADPHTLSHSPASGTCPGQEPREGRDRGWVHPVLYLSLHWPEPSREAGGGGNRSVELQRPRRRDGIKHQSCN